MERGKGRENCPGRICPGGMSGSGRVCTARCVIAAGTFLFETRLGCLQLQVPERTRKFIGALEDMLKSSLYLIVGEELHQKLNTSFWRRHADSWDRLFAIGQSHLLVTVLQVYPLSAA